MKNLLTVILFLVCCIGVRAMDEELTLMVPPANDNFANAQTIASPIGLVNGTNVDATKEAGEPNHAGNVGGRSVWYKWTPNITFGVTFSTHGFSTNFDTLVAVYTGASVNSLTQIVGRDDYGNTNASRVFFPAAAGTTYYIAVDGYNNGTIATGTFTLTWDSNRLVSSGTDLDGSPMNGSNRDDITVFRPSNGLWAGLMNTGTTTTWGQFGAVGDIPVPADYDGDGRTDFAVFRPGTGDWWALLSATNVATVKRWGLNGDIPTIGDFDANGLADAGVFRPSTGVWYVRAFVFNYDIVIQQFGQSGDKPAHAHYDGDGRMDLAVFRPSTGTWWIRRTIDDTVQTVNWGVSGDVPVPGDYGDAFDGKSDIAVFRPSNGTWYVRASSDNSTAAVRWGTQGDIPQPMNAATATNLGGVSDFVVYRPSNQTWYILDSSDLSTRIVKWGSSGDVPAAAGYVVQHNVID